MPALILKLGQLAIRAGMGLGQIRPKREKDPERIV